MRMWRSVAWITFPSETMIVDGGSAATNCDWEWLDYLRGFEKNGSDTSVWFRSISFDFFFFLGRAMIRLGVGTEELAFLSTLALVSTDNLAISSASINLLREVETNVLKAFRLYMLQRWSSRPTLVGKLIILLLDVRLLRYSSPLDVWLEPGKCFAAACC